MNYERQFTPISEISLALNISSTEIVWNEPQRQSGIRSNAVAYLMYCFIFFLVCNCRCYCAYIFTVHPLFQKKVCHSDRNRGRENEDKKKKRLGRVFINLNKVL